jgi:hypothetical protein
MVTVFFALTNCVSTLLSIHQKKLHSNTFCSLAHFINNSAYYKLSDKHSDQRTGYFILNVLIFSLQRNKKIRYCCQVLLSVFPFFYKGIFL